jgi:hypothetical protein
MNCIMNGKYQQTRPLHALRRHRLTVTKDLTNECMQLQECALMKLSSEMVSERHLRLRYLQCCGHQESTYLCCKALGAMR